MVLLSKIFKIKEQIKKWHMFWLRQEMTREHAIVCVAMILNYNCIETTMKSLRKKYPKGIDLQGMISFFTEKGFKTKAIHCPISELRNLRLPCILHWKMQQFSVLEKISNEKFHIIDPSSIQNIFSLEEISIHYCEVALEVFIDDAGILEA